MNCLYCTDPDPEFYPRNKTRCKKCVIKHVMVSRHKYSGSAEPWQVERMKRVIRTENLEKMRKVG